MSVCEVFDDTLGRVSNDPSGRSNSGGTDDEPNGRQNPERDRLQFPRVQRRLAQLTIDVVLEQ
ncbi:hypothetical protein JCM18237_15640 [Halorubrum luteum]